MILFKNLYLNAYSYSFPYIEGNLILLMTKINTKKMKFKDRVLFKIRSCFLTMYRSIMSIFNSDIVKSSSFINNLFFSSLIGYIHGFRLIGRGYKAYLDSNSFLFRLGYSHNVYYVLPFYLSGLEKPKFKKFWLIRSFDFSLVSRFIYVIRNFRIPNKYMHKGIYVKNNIVDYDVRATKIGML